jgi:hypothetical protein
MILSLEQLTKIVAGGGGLRIDAQNFTMSQLQAICASATAGNARLELINVSAFSASQLLLLAQAAPGLILFDFTTSITPTPAGSTSAT